MCFFVGRMYWPRVRQSISAARISAGPTTRSVLGKVKKQVPLSVWRTCSSVSPTPSMRDVLVMRSGLVALAVSRTRSDWR